MVKFYLLIISLLILSAPSRPAPGDAPSPAECTLKGKKLYGKVQVVESFPDIKVQVVRAFPDLRVQQVEAFPNSCGKWQYVESFPDFKIQFVEAFPDLKVQFVEAFPGVPNG